MTNTVDPSPLTYVLVRRVEFDSGSVVTLPLASYDTEEAARRARLECDSLIGDPPPGAPRAWSLLGIVAVAHLVMGLPREVHLVEVPRGF